MPNKSKGVELIAAERIRQIENERFDSRHDDDHFHKDGELARAAVAYAAPEPVFTKQVVYDDEVFADVWPEDWSSEYDKRKRNAKGVLSPSRRSRKEMIRDLVKSGALIAAEIDRLLRLEQKKSKR
jgi:hypothetical protein